METFLQFIETSLNQLELHRQISIECEVEDYSIKLNEKVIEYLKKVLNVISHIEKSVNYINLFQNDIIQILNYFPYRQQGDLNFLSDIQKSPIKSQIESQNEKIEKQLKLLEFNFSFFNKLGFFFDNIVAIGANGSGKTSLSNDLKKYLPNAGVVISAQKVMIIPTFSGVSNFNNTNQKLQNTQTIDKSLKVTYSTENQGNAWGIMTQIGGEFQVLLDNLLAERSAIRNKFFDKIQNGQVITDVPVTKLDKTLKIWNSLIQHRTLECVDGINITLRSISNDNSYPAHQMSDGEKVTLYLIAHVLQAPTSGFIIIDEPEMYLHKTILKKLWDILEQDRQDCIFIYLTHDLDFATSRTAKKVWIKSFEHPNNWEIEDIPENELPESLLLELLGSRKNILFCEGKKGSIDEKVYNILFPNFTITPVDNCFAVINYTKAFNKLPNATTKAYGLIDLDHHSQLRIKALEPENIFSFSMTEPENLFFDEDFLKLMSNQLLQDISVIGAIKSDVIKLLEKEIELQVSNYVSTKINYYFKDSHVSKGNTLTNIKENYSKFTNEIKIQEWYDKRKAEIEEIIKSNDYSKTLSIFNNKGLKTIANKYFKISDFTDRAIRLLQFQPESREILKKYFPNVIRNKNGL
jgi:ABC-type cobalamin/Fe3+-siderophores transport system ATPase subunit